MSGLERALKRFKKTADGNADLAAHLKKRAAFFARPKLSDKERAAHWPHADYCQKLSDRIEKQREQGRAAVICIRFTEEV